MNTHHETTRTCDLCPRHCVIKNGETGFCGARANTDGAISCISYGCVTAMALDPVEKKPLAMYKSGSHILSVGSFGCNFRCPFCQNYGISMMRAAEGTAAAGYTRISPEQLVAKAESLTPQGNTGIAYTYNEPLIGYEFVRDTARLAKSRGLDNVVVTNGCISQKYLDDLLPYIDAMNIDLKAFSDAFYGRISGFFDTVKDSIALAAGRCHVELTCLVIPGENDSKEEMEAMCAFIASLSRDIPLHITRFFPRYKYADRSPTQPDTVRNLARIARSALNNVFLGNM